MTGPPHGTATATAHRADYGAVRLGRRDIDGLILCAEQYGAPYDLLAAALPAQPARLRGIVARWRRAGFAATGRLGPGPAWCGMKVRFKIRIETGRKAAALNAQQAEAIKELLQWAVQHQPHSG